ncbi:hypothetical protein OG245_19760 [Streptomyces sp. NBC_01116]
MLSYGPDLIDPAVPRTACAHPPLRCLHPLVSHGVLVSEPVHPVAADT